MTTALVLDAQATVQVQEADTKYRQQHPLQIAMCLRNLMSHHERVTVEFENRQMLIQVLDVDSRHGRFTFTYGNVDADNHALLEADQLTFHSVPGAIDTHFTTGGASKVRFDDRAAFEAAFPNVLYYVQRREHFRVHTPSVEPFIASGADASGTAFRVELVDMSLGGIAFKTTEARFATFEVGSILQGVELTLAHSGSLHVDLEIMSPRQSTNAKGEPQYVVGCRFVERIGSAERLLQRVIMQLETKRQSLARA